MAQTEDIFFMEEEEGTSWDKVACWEKPEAFLGPGGPTATFLR